MTTILIRSETAADRVAREDLLESAFGPTRFEKTCERLREGRLPAVALVAEVGGRIVGSVRLWAVAAGPGRPALVLGPLAVDGASRRAGIGARLVATALNQAAAGGHGAVLLVGDAPYYARFGFTAALTGALWMPGPVERERFLAVELQAGSLAGARGLVSPTGPVAPKPDLAALVAAAMAAANDDGRSARRAA
jgi:GNAT superfamily N-acetyltransferase